MAPHARLPLLALTTAVVLVGSLFTATSPARADTAPPNSTTPQTVAADVLPTVQINGVVWTQAIVGNTVYVGGEFTRARPAGAAPGVSEVTRNNMLAYDLTTGALTSFDPNMNASVRALTASPDGTRLYAGGTFTTVGGVSRTRIAAFTTATGALSSSWAPSINGHVRALGATASSVYVGGSFSSASGQARSNIAAFSASTGALLPWSGAPSGGYVSSLTISPDATKVVIGGSFTSYNGNSNPGYGMAATNASTGASLPWRVNGLLRNAGPDAAVTSLTGSAEGVFGTGYVYGTGGNFEGAFRASWADGTLTWMEDCHGDTHSAVPVTNAVYTVGHAHYCGNVGGFPETNPRSFYRAIAFSMNATGLITRNATGNYQNFQGQPRPTLLHFYPNLNSGTYTGQYQGPWHVTANSQYVVFGGEFTTVNDKRQQGLVRAAIPTIAPNKEGPRVSGAEFVPTLSTPLTGTVRVTWTSNYDRDNEQLKYEVLRNGVVVYTVTGLSAQWKRPTMSWNDVGRTPGTAYTYQLRATDPFGNLRTGNSVTVTAG